MSLPASHRNGHGVAGFTGAEKVLGRIKDSEAYGGGHAGLPVTVMVAVSVKVAVAVKVAVSLNRPAKRHLAISGASQATDLHLNLHQPLGRS